MIVYNTCDVIDGPSESDVILITICPSQQVMKFVVFVALLFELSISQLLDPESAG